jgi:GNAT superfamily N-acetyltransferase
LIDEIILRPAGIDDAEGIARVRVESWRTTYRGILPDVFLDSMSVDRYRHTWADILAYDKSMFTFVAVNKAGNIVGFAGGGPERDGNPKYQAELYVIYLLQEYQGMGIGQALAQTVARKLLEEGYKSLIVWVLAQNQARGFYEKLGGVYVGEKPITLGGTNYREVSYGWDEIRDLIKETK